GHPADLVEKIHVPGAAAELAIGYSLEADLLLHLRGIADRCVLGPAQFLGGEPASLMLGARPQQLRWAQKAADMVGAERRTRQIAHRNLPILVASFDPPLLRHCVPGK